MNRFVKFFIDWVALFSVGSITQAATGSVLWAVVGIVAVGAYGIVCFMDGAGMWKSTPHTNN